MDRIKAMNEMLLFAAYWLFMLGLVKWAWRGVCKPIGHQTRNWTGRQQLRKGGADTS